MNLLVKQRQPLHTLPQSVGLNVAEVSCALRRSDDLRRSLASQAALDSLLDTDHEILTLVGEDFDPGSPTEILP